MGQHLSASLVFHIPSGSENDYLSPSIPMNHLRLLDAVVHVVEGAGPGRLDVKPEMTQGLAGHSELRGWGVAVWSRCFRNVFRRSQESLNCRNSLNLGAYTFDIF